MPKGTLTIAKEHKECKDGTCGHPHELEIELPEIKTPAIITQTQPATGANPPEEKPKPVEKTVIKTQAPSDQPFFKCKNCGDKHDNPNYSIKPNKKCPNCGSLNGNKNCKNCGNATDSDDWEELDDDELIELGIPIPEENHKHDGHDHETD